MADTFSVTDKDNNQLAKDVPSPVTISQLTPNTVYPGWKATKNDGDATLTVPDQTTLPSKPSLTLTAGAKQFTANVKLATGDGSAPITKVVISYKTGSDPAKTKEFDNPTDLTQLVVDGLNDNTAYDATVVVSNVSGDSNASDSASATTIALPLAPKITATDSEDGKTDFTIQPAANDGADSYNIYSKETSGAWPDKPTKTTTPDKLSGTIDGLTDGTAYTIAVTAVNGAGESDINADGASAHITPKAVIAVTGIAFGGPTTTVTMGTPKQVVATITPDNATDKGITYKSSDETIATVAADGTVTGVKTGTANITATAHADNTKTATVAVTIAAAS
ncbi:fibronectin type III domain protein [Lentilactobacillus sunkii]|uniref:Fibronectin type III domain protein n=1 Tax=Lentilactobacillus sunkii TaxID=481719 RepID=A0A1E7XCB9_9LACO|nr:fibronectin type III domain-containing protein [Lentilactobacillus sunkii]OFA10757.1 fibronectin type III domain protein [Lentilactobacillus sunkii]